MRITREQICDQSRRGHLIICCLVGRDDLMDEIIKQGHADVVLIINGKEVDIESYVKQWQSEVYAAIQEEALALLKTRCRNIITVLDDLEGHANEALNKIQEGPPS